jgi:hypothetical protein
MALIKVTAIDSRLLEDEGNQPVLTHQAPMHFTVNKDTVLEEFFKAIRRKVDKNFVTMMSFYAHSMVRYQFEYINDPRLKWANPYGAYFGGYGMKFCKEWIIKATAHHFKILAPLFEKGGIIELVACSIANAPDTYAAPDTRNIFTGDGIETLQAVAKAAHAAVRASPDPQIYSHRFRSRDKQEVFNFGKWDGQVFLFDPDGDIRWDRISERTDRPSKSNP